VVERFGEAKGVLLMRKYACCYAQGKPGAREFRRRAALMRSAEEFFEIVERHFPLLDSLQPEGEPAEVLN
jgi:tRNA-dihydrouridine synthase B